MPASTTKKTKQKRELKTPKYKSFRLSKRIKHTAPPLPKARVLFMQTIQDFRRLKWPISLILLIFLALFFFFVRGFAGSNLDDVRTAFEQVGEERQLNTGLGLFAYLVGTTSAPTSDAAVIYQTLLVVIVSLAIIWLARQNQSPSKVEKSVRKAYYLGSAPVVPFLLVLTVVVLQLIPGLIMSSVYFQISVGGIAAGNVENFVWLLIALFGLLLSGYMLTSSLFALYIVTLPNVTPMEALRSARELVRHRRLVIVRKILFLPVVLLSVALVVFVPVLFYFTTIGELLFLVYVAFALALVNMYMYKLYKSLL